jgi:dTDP-L-rhamnose 4-epimerase
MTKRILVTGGAGFIGSHLVDALIKEGHKVRIIDNLEPQVHDKVPDYLNKDAEFINADVRSKQAIKKALKNIDVIFHFAAMVGVAQSMYQIEKYTDVNTFATSKLLEVLVSGKYDIEKLVVASSNTIYGEGSYSCDTCGVVYPEHRSEKQLLARDWEMQCPDCGKKVKPIPTAESRPLSPTSIYAIGKRDVEEMCLIIGKAYKIPTVALRFFCTYGTRQSMSNPYTGVAAIFLSLIKNNKPPLLYEDGRQLRDFTSVHDIVQANLLAMNKKEADYETFNVAASRSVSINRIAEVLIKLCNKNIKPVVVGKYRTGDIRHCYADITKIKRKLGFTPRVQLEDGMRELIEWGQNEAAVDKTQEAQQELMGKRLIK